MLVKDIMTKNPVTVAPERSVPEAKDIMTKNNIGKLPVLDKSGALVGILTKNDLIKATPSDATTLDMFELSYLLSKLTVQKVMNKDVKTVSPVATVEDAARLMADYEIGCLPVMENNLIVGIVTESDLFHTFIDLFSTRESGVRATVELNEKPGELSILSSSIAGINGNIVSVVTCPGAPEGKRKVTIKASGITKEQLNSFFEKNNIPVEDIRNV